MILQRDGLILTNNHVVEGTTGITVSFNDDKHTTPLKGTVIGTAPERDLAVVRVEANDLVPVAAGPLLGASPRRRRDRDRLPGQPRRPDGHVRASSPGSIARSRARTAT